MDALFDGLGDAFRLIVHGDRDLIATTLRTLRIGVEATLLAALLGLPLGCLLGLRRFRGRGVLLTLANAGMRTPPVVLGLLLWVALWPDSRWGGGPLAGLGWIYTLDAVILAQTLLALPIVIALTAAAVQAVPAALLDQARAFGASPWQTALLALREARIGVVAALLTALGTAMAAVGAILVVGTSLGNATLATAALTNWEMGGQNAAAVAYGTVLLGIFLVLAAALTRLQHRRTWAAQT
ncbi:ABC transporter permease [Conexibacter sp. JD483]|uniref:ABC transporter permease n=1 Tax=unclassified Conexibacter TaxID=2627773 RepID=UPI00271828AB|nr:MULTISPECIES: ABC transporter permease [unclassified Conexibacter]MDO8186082.1 ABC transporter permease [Conexibacter sp. CPCC 205706]MDO8199572.1 ABC transporter permease [Conexibacter sp. CPCC 205762]MDR9373017.1 ABC transporter permease [Conexibacter sp. JD483]